jgi:hypothetical protein
MDQVLYSIFQFGASVLCITPFPNFFYSSHSRFWLSIVISSDNIPQHNVVRLTPLGEPPSPRAAHVATAVGTMVVIQVLYTSVFCCCCFTLVGASFFVRSVPI